MNRFNNLKNVRKWIGLNMWTALRTAQNKEEIAKIVINLQ